ncbi:ankyrin repeat domain-containing protein 66 isoform X2 [Hydra vulgaris]|uniref:Ankyrin repeat domain-containing protein 66 isoform X2 n=1 Tax=Hydra vulgaris TaxID=6087 RepID=A0ABM4BF93_HYDVU
MTEFLCHELAANGDSLQLEAFLKTYGNKFINFPDSDFSGRAPLHWAIIQGRYKCCKVLLENGANPMLRMQEGWSPAHCAAEIGNIEILKLLESYSADLDCNDDFGATPRRIAEIHGHWECVKYLDSLTKKADK